MPQHVAAPFELVGNGRRNMTETTTNNELIDNQRNFLLLIQLPKWLWIHCSTRKRLRFHFGD